MLTTYGNPLVAGMAANSPMVTNKKVKVLRPFYIGNVVQKKDAVIEVPPALYAELLSSRKVELHVEDEKPTEKPAAKEKK